MIDGDTGHPADPTSFRELDFTVSLADLVPADGLACAFAWNRTSIPPSPMAPH